MKKHIETITKLSLLFGVSFYFKDHIVIENGSIHFYFKKNDIPYIEKKSENYNRDIFNNKANNKNTDNQFQENPNDNVVFIDYDFYQLNYNCDKGGFDNFMYTTVPDANIDLSRHSPFYYDKQVTELCKYDSERSKKAQNTKTYKSPSRKNPQYDRGHGTHQNIWDHDKSLMKTTNYMSNIVPQEKNQNRKGLWRHSEKLTECYRDLGTVKVVGGNIWGNDSSNDYFLNSHGVVTPDFLFKIMLINNKPYSFIVPNNPEATSENHSKYMTSINDIEIKTGYTFDFDNNLKSIVNEVLPNIPKNCSLK